eukprot:938030-Rhodomonas_salina.1
MRKRREWHGSKLARNPLSGSSAPPSASFVAHPRTPAPGPCSALRSARDCRAACGACVSSSLRNHIQATAQGCRLPARIWVLASPRPKQSPQGRVLRTRRWWEQASVLDGALRHSLRAHATRPPSTSGQKRPSGSDVPRSLLARSLPDASFNRDE